MALRASLYDIGDLVRLTATFTVGGSVSDPTAVNCRIRKPDGTIVITGATRASTGVYTATVSTDQAGDWYYRFEGSGAAQAAEEALFVVRRTNVVASRA